MFISVAMATDPSASGGILIDERLPLGVKLTDGGYPSFHAAMPLARRL